MSALRAGIGEVWGAGRGPLSRRSPDTRIGAGALVLAACLVAPADTPVPAVFVAATALGWVLTCGAPWRIVGPALGAGALMLAPLWLLTPWIEPTDPFGAVATGTRTAPWVVVAGIVVKGLGSMVAALATVTTLERWDWHEGLARLPLPRAITALLAQLVHQSGQLLGETRRIAAAMAVRGGTGRLGTALSLVRALPSAWLPRLLARADRTAAAMELRGLGWELPRFRVIRRTAADGLALAGALLWLAAAVALRLGGGR